MTAPARRPVRGAGRSEPAGHRRAARRRRRSVGERRRRAADQPARGVAPPPPAEGSGARGGGAAGHPAHLPPARRRRRGGRGVPHPGVGRRGRRGSASLAENTAPRRRRRKPSRRDRRTAATQLRDPLPARARVRRAGPRACRRGGRRATRRRAIPTPSSTLEPRLGGRIFERTPDGSEIDWGEITAWDPPHRLGYLWHIGRTSRGRHRRVELTFVDLGDGPTRLDIVHSGWDRLGADGAQFRHANTAGWDGTIPAFRAAAEARA